MPTKRTKKETKLYRDKEWYSLNDLADFIAEFNKDGKCDKTAWEFWNWFDRKCKISDKKILDGERTKRTKTTEEWENERYLRQLKEMIKNIRYYYDLTWNAGLNKDGDKLVKYKNKAEEEIELFVLETLQQERDGFSKVLEGLKMKEKLHFTCNCTGYKHWCADNCWKSPHSHNKIVNKLNQKISTAQKRIK